MKQVHLLLQIIKLVLVFKYSNSVQAPRKGEFFLNTYITFMIIINTAMLLSVWLTRHKFHILEILAYWMFICTVIQQVFTMLTINLHFIGITQGVGIFWFLIMNRLILFPLLIIWLFYFFKDISLVHKTVLTGIWVIALSCIQFLSKKFCLITFSKWNFVYSLAEWLIVILISFGFLLWFRFLLKKEELIV
jgi:hypothetical protein